MKYLNIPSWTAQFIEVKKPVQVVSKEWPFNEFVGDYVGIIVAKKPRYFSQHYLDKHPWMRKVLKRNEVVPELAIYGMLESVLLNEVEDEGGERCERFVHMKFNQDAHLLRFYKKPHRGRKHPPREPGLINSPKSTVITLCKNRVSFYPLKAFRERREFIENLYSLNIYLVPVQFSVEKREYLPREEISKFLKDLN